MYIIISGINRVSYQLGENFIAQGNEVTFIESNQHNVSFIEENLGFLTILGNSYNKKNILFIDMEQKGTFGELLAKSLDVGDLVEWSKWNSEEGNCESNYGIIVSSSF